MTPGSSRGYLERAKLGNVALLAGVIPLKSAKMAAWLNASVPGVQVPQALIDEMEAAGPEGEAATGIAIAARLIRAMKDLCAGVHIMALGWESRIPEILSASGVR
jgi:methylenetetrahydrofolate reductase (NADPH)